MTDAASIERPFSSRALFVLLVVTAASLLTAFLLVVFRTDQLTRTTVDANSYSRSAIGHRTVVELLGRLGVPLVTSRRRGTEGADDRTAGALLACLEPDDADRDTLAAFARDQGRLLLVLPKRGGTPGAADQGWLGSAHQQAIGDVEAVLHAVFPAGRIVRPSESSVWRVAGGALPAPTISEPQLLRPHPELRALVRNDQGVLFGEVRTASGSLWILSDPDPIANHGIDDGDNASFAKAVFEHCRADHGVVIDETMHGFGLPPSFLADLGRWPLVLLLVQFLLLLAAVAWAASGRFGAPVDAGPALAAGKHRLIETTAALLLQSRHTAHSLRQFLDDRVQAAAARLQGRGHDERTATAALTARAAARGQAGVLDALRSDVEAATRETGPRGGAAALALAQRIHRTCEEIVHGSE